MRAYAKVIGLALLGVAGVVVATVLVTQCTPHLRVLTDRELLLAVAALQVLTLLRQ